MNALDRQAPPAPGGQSTPQPPAAANPECHIDICICTFRRPMLTETLASLQHLVVPPGCHLRVLVVDNDDTPSARQRAEAAELPFPLVYIHAPARNISIARNAGLAAADAEYLAFLDDDERVTPEWLLQLYATARDSGADLVFGPAVSIYPTDTEAWMVDGDYHSTKPPPRHGALTTGCSANVLIRRHADCVTGLRFDPNLGRCGGEDTVFFRQVFARGGVLRFATEARVYEEVAPQRLSLAWLLQRKLRAGQSHARAQILTSATPLRTRLTLLVSALAKGSLCAVMSGAHIANRARRNFWLIRGALHLGTASKCFGLREQTLYGQG